MAEDDHIVTESFRLGFVRTSDAALRFLEDVVSLLITEAMSQDFSETYEQNLGRFARHLSWSHHQRVDITDGVTALVGIFLFLGTGYLEPRSGYIFVTVHRRIPESVLHVPSENPRVIPTAAVFFFFSKNVPDNFGKLHSETRQLKGSE